MPKVRITYIMSSYKEVAETCIDLHVTEAVAESLYKYQGESPYVSYAGAAARDREAAENAGGAAGIQGRGVRDGGAAGERVRRKRKWLKTEGTNTATSTGTAGRYL